MKRNLRIINDLEALFFFSQLCTDLHYCIDVCLYCEYVSIHFKNYYWQTVCAYICTGMYIYIEREKDTEKALFFLMENSQ